MMASRRATWSKRNCKVEQITVSVRRCVLHGCRICSFDSLKLAAFPNFVSACEVRLRQTDLNRYFNLRCKFAATRRGDAL